MLSSIELGAVLAPAMSIIGVTVLYHYLGREYLGADENRVWNQLRRVLLGGLDSYVRDRTPFALTNKAFPRELVGSLDMSSQEVAELFESAGYVQGVLSGLKTRDLDGTRQYENGSMVFRESKSDLIPDALALYQNHVFWFEKGDGTCDLYAHYEYSSTNPLVAWPHYLAVGQDAEKGKKLAAAVLK